MAWSPCDGWVTGRDPNVNVNVNVLGVFVEDKKFDSKLVRFNLHIRRLQRNAFVYISEKISTFVLLS